MVFFSPPPLLSTFSWHFNQTSSSISYPTYTVVNDVVFIVSKFEILESDNLNPRRMEQNKEVMICNTNTLKTFDKFKKETQKKSYASEFTVLAVMCYFSTRLYSLDSIVRPSLF